MIQPPALPQRSKQLNKVALPTVLKSLKPVLFTESPTPSNRPPVLVPNIRSLSWSPTGSLVATCTSAHIRIWSPERPNVKSSTEIRNGHNGSFSGGPGGSAMTVEKVAFCPTRDKVLASTGADGGVRLWDVRVPGGTAGPGKGIPMADCRIGEPGVSLTWHPQGMQLLALTKDDTLQSIDVRMMSYMDDVKCELEPIDRTLSSDRTRIDAVSFSNSGREVFACTGDGPVKILDYPSMTPIHALVGHTHAAYAVQHSPLGNWVAVGSGDSMVTLWDTRNWFCGHMLGAHTSAVRDLSFSFDGSYLICGSGVDAKDGSSGLELYHVDTGDVAHIIDTANPVTVCAWHPHRYWIAYAGDPGGLKIVGASSNV